jgi:hypothetical protein
VCFCILKNMPACLPACLTHSMEQSPSWEANNHSTSEEISSPFVAPEGLLLCSQAPATSSHP